MGKLKPWVAHFLILFTVSTVHASADFNQRLAEARRQYFANLQGDHAAGDQARASFRALAHDYPEQPVVEAYSGSLELSKRLAPGRFGISAGWQMKVYKRWTRR